MTDPPERLRTAALATRSGYSVQQVRDLERRGVIPPARRTANGYRQFEAVHVTALRTYRRLAAAIGPVAARTVLPDLRTLPLDLAAATINDLHTGLAAERTEALAAQRILELISTEVDAPTGDAGDAMPITELAGALGVRTSTLRFWERAGLLHPDRVTRHAVRSYPLAAVREARIIVALRSAGYRIPEVREALQAVRALGEVDEPLAALHHRLDTIARRTVALLAAGADLAALLTETDQLSDAGAGSPN